MIESEWSTCRDPIRLLRGLSAEVYGRELRLFGCACCRRVWGLITDKRLMRGVEVMEDRERGLMAEQELRDAQAAARLARKEIRHRLIVGGCDERSIDAAPAWAAGAVANAVYGNYHAASDFAARAKACAEVSDWQRSYEAERAAQCDLLRSMVRMPPSSPEP